jgi:hypothetical protein
MDDSKVVDVSEYSLKMSSGDIVKKCRLCNNVTISLPLEIVHKDGGTLCATCNSTYLPKLHETLHLYLDKYRHHLRKFQTEKGRMFSMVIGLSGTLEDEESFFINIGYDLSRTIDRHDINYLYYAPQDEESFIGRVHYRVRPKVEKAALSNKILTSVHDIYRTAINCLAITDIEYLDFDNEWRLISRDGLLPTEFK